MLQPKLPSKDVVLTTVTELVTSDDPPVALFYGSPPEMGKDAKAPAHATNFGLALKGPSASCGRLIYPGSADSEFPVIHKFNLAKLNRAK